jgi:dihydrofolate reductase
MLRVDCFAISADGYAAGPNQSLENPLGEGGTGLHNWMFGTETFQTRVLGKDGGTKGADNDFAARSFENVGAWILGRNMFGPVRGPWPDDQWKGWWGEEPPYRVPVFVLTHHARASLEMKGGTVFHFVTGGADEALRRAREAAGAKDVRVGGGAATINQYLRRGAIDRFHLVVSPILLGSGAKPFDGVDLTAQGFDVVEKATTEHAMHVVFEK